MPYRIRKAKCKQTDGDRGSYVLSYKDNKGKRHRNCHTSRKKARAQISAIEMPEGIEELEESWVPLATRIAELLEGELAQLAGSFLLNESESGGFKLNDRVRFKRKPSKEELRHAGGVPKGTIVKVHDNGTYDVEWDPLPRPPKAGPDWEPEDNLEPKVPGQRLELVKAGSGKRRDRRSGD